MVTQSRNERGKADEVEPVDGKRRRRPTVCFDVRHAAAAAEERERNMRRSRKIEATKRQKRAALADPARGAHQPPRRELPAITCALVPTPIAYPSSMFPPGAYPPVWCGAAAASPLASAVVYPPVYPSSVYPCSVYPLIR